MISNFNDSSSYVIGNTVVLKGKQLPPPPSYNTGYCRIVMSDDKVFINGYEWKDGKWKRTLRALWHLWF